MGEEMTVTGAEEDKAGKPEAVWGAGRGQARVGKEWC